MTSKTTHAAQLRTEFDFELPRGYLDSDGVLHRHGRMRLATGRDELSPLIDQRVRENPAYLGVVLLSLVITALGTLPRIDAGVVEKLLATDLAYLQSFYRTINGLTDEACAVACPNCGTQFALPAPWSGLGES
ncbi:hypothetical protein ME763_36935 (plasmid) [Streptomyces murinus]|uniref:hypothetical protein n=1 Tax=Streptomyces murinus TaxID=33900 RepID=UPI002377D4C0|nr:hypothetical protein [Streptomyces murinus]WDO11321.1 hypothetical protein ME763_36935 [Streptomyces murinus]